MKKIQKSEIDNKKQTWAKQKSESEFQNLKSSAKKFSKYTLENQRKENSKVYPKIAFTLSTIFVHSDLLAATTNLKSRNCTSH